MTLTDAIIIVAVIYPTALFLIGAERIAATPKPPTGVRVIRGLIWLTVGYLLPVAVIALTVTLCGLAFKLGAQW